MSAWTVAPEATLAGYQVEWEEPGELVLSRRNQLFRTTAPGAPLTPVAEFPASRWKAEAARFRPAQRALRFLYYNVIKLPDGRLFASFDRSVGVAHDGRFARLPGLVRPCRILRSGCALARDGNVYFGEYILNPGHDQEIHLYRYAPGGNRIEVARRFPPGFVRHIHGIYSDPHDGSLWFVSGDLDAECRMLRSRDGFETFEVVGEGDETWRCVSLAFTERAIYYATDSEFRRNQVFRLDRATGVRSLVGDIDGPVYVGKAVGQDVFFAVTAELCPSQVGRSATLWHVDEKDRLSKCVAFEKDALHRVYFMVGTLHLTRGPGFSDRFYMHGVALRNADNRTFVVRRQLPEESSSGN
jgi:hypothetical protein